MIRFVKIDIKCPYCGLGDSIETVVSNNESTRFIVCNKGIYQEKGSPKALGCGEKYALVLKFVPEINYLKLMK